MTSFSSTLSPEGRVVIPAPLRAALALKPGDTVTFRLEGDYAVITSRSAALSQLQAMFARVGSEKGRLLSDELVAERRADAAQESSAE